MAEDTARTRRWQKIDKPAKDVDPIGALRSSIADVRKTPRDPEARRRLRAFAAEQGLWEQLALLLADEARAAMDRGRVEIATALFEELADVYENLDQPLETIVAMEAVVELAPEDIEHHDRLARLYHQAGAWSKAAGSFERVAQLARDDRARAALHAAGRLYRDNAKLDRAVEMYRAIVQRKPSDTDAWQALDKLLTQLGRWQELAIVRGELADRAQSGVEKAVLLRGQARALEEAGDTRAAAELVAEAARHAPDHVSGIVDYAQVLARDGRSREAADILAARVEQAIEDNASAEDLAALRFRLAAILEEVCDDRPAATAVLEELLDESPEYLPALEKLVRHRAEDPDPRVHAGALLRSAAALPENADAAYTMVDAGRKFREAGDHHAAVRAFEDASELLPDDRALLQELDDARTVVVVERAAAEASRGDALGAERRLRSILEAHPHHLAANLALVDVFERGGRDGDAAEHLRDTLAEAPDDLPKDQLAPLVHRYALVMAAMGEADEAHQLLHEAALQLGSLAAHPDAARHAAAVGTGLVHAALAEIRALRPGNAYKHYEAAVRIDPQCAKAGHALAERAIEQEDMAKAAECLEREAAATTDPRERLRLFDALGDLALDVLGDAVRAEKCWSQVATTVPVLRKLLAIQRRRGAGLERGDTCERLAELITDQREQKELTEEAAEALVAGGDLPRARAAAKRLMASYPLDVDAVSCASSIALAAEDSEKAATWLQRALAAWDASGDRGAGDPRRADLWRRLGDALLARGELHGAQEAYQRAIVTAPDADAALAARRGLVDLSASTGRPAAESLAVLVEADQHPGDVLAWARERARTNHVDEARAMYELARALGEPLATGDERFLAQHPVRPMASDEAYAAPLDDAERRALIDDPADAPLAEILDILGEVASLVCPDARTALGTAGFADARRVPPTSDAATAALYPQIANALGGPQTLLYATQRGPDVTILLAAPPVIVIGPRLASIRARSQHDAELTSDADLRFKLGRVVELARWRRVLALGDGSDRFTRLVGGLAHAFGRATKVDPATATEAERLRQAMPLQLRRRMTERFAAVDTIDPAPYLDACVRAADRAGLLVCGNVEVAIRIAGGATDARHLVQLAASPRYLAARRKLRFRKS